MKRLRLTILLILVTASLILAGCGGASAPGSGETVQVATDATWPPFEMVNESNNEIEGFDIDLLKAIGEKEGINFQFQNVAFDPLLAGMATCQYDVAVSAITITADRAQSMAFSDPYFSAGQVVAVRQETTDINSKDDLGGKTAGAQIGTTGAIEIEAMPDATLKTYDDIGLAFQDLMNGQVDAVVADDGLAQAYVSKNSDKLKMVGEPFTDESYGIAVCKTKPELVEKINSGLAKVKEEGTLDQLTQKWLVGEE